MASGVALGAVDLRPAPQLRVQRERARVQPAADILRAATSTAARLLHMEGQVGTLAVGSHADLLVVDGNPLDDISILTRPQRNLRHVIRAGQLI